METVQITLTDLDRTQDGLKLDQTRGLTAGPEAYPLLCA